MRIFDTLKYFLFTLFFLTVGFKTKTPLSVESQKYLHDILANHKFKPTELKDNYLKYNFAPLWLSTLNSSVVGIIGNGNRRLQMKLLSALEDSIRTDTYFITGKSKASNTI